jgi:hypothetical protein
LACPGLAIERRRKRVVIIIKKREQKAQDKLESATAKSVSTIGGNKSNGCPHCQQRYQVVKKEQLEFMPLSNVAIVRQLVSWGIIQYQQARKKGKVPRTNKCLIFTKLYLHC